ncbi:MAG: L-fucose:H+ symporter permease [Lentisphaerales bacterium]|nr:L-fucose:H+ symporter permease [Lentisphaerales bacterium]
MASEVENILGNDDLETMPLKQERTVSKTEKTIPYLIPFALITACFALWGFANDITNPLVKSFEKIFLTSTFDATLVQAAFYGGYGVMAIPAALFIRKYSYKSGVLMGLGLFSLGCFLFLPASHFGTFYPFLGVYFIITCGLSFLETTCNPYILSMGPQETATQRLNLAQAFNPIGSLMGMFIAMNFITAKMSPMAADERRKLNSQGFEVLKQSDLGILSTPYVLCGAVILLMFIIISMYKMPDNKVEETHDLGLKAIFGRLLQSKRYREGTITQMFYVGAQIMCWTFIIHFGTEVFMSQGLSEQAAELKSQRFNIYAMLLFCFSRFICTFLLKYIKPGVLLATLAYTAILFTCGIILQGGVFGMYCLVGISACMSLMFPTIYGISLNGFVGDEAKIAAAGLIVAIVGGCIMPMAQAWAIDYLSVQLSFVMPLICFVVIAVFGLRVVQVHDCEDEV